MISQPATNFAVLLAMAFGRWAADANQLAALKGDAVASLADVANWCAAHDVVARDLQVETRTLEDVFLDLTGRELRA